MKIKITEIEASAEDLRQSKSLSEAFTDAFKRTFILSGLTLHESEEEEDDEDQV